MTDDRYTRALGDLRGGQAPDQWDEITDRAADDGTVVVLDGERGRSPDRRRLTLAAAAVASVAALASAVWFVQDDDKPSTITSRPGPDGESAPFDADVPPDPACDPARLISNSPPEGLAGEPQPPTVEDPRVPPEMYEKVVGTYPGDATTTVVFSISGHPDIVLGNGVPGTARYEDGWIGWADVTAPDGTVCGFTFVGIGLEQDDFAQFLAGLGFRMAQG